MSSAELHHSERWEWTCQPAGLYLPPDRARDSIERIRYREHGAETFRMVLLIREAGVPLTDELVVRAIDEHAATRSTGAK